jgi:hypothetical protein
MRRSQGEHRGVASSMFEFLIGQSPRALMGATDFHLSQCGKPATSRSACRLSGYFLVTNADLPKDHRDR